MSIAPNPPTSALLATTAMSASGAAASPEFPVVTRGYDKQHVQEWVRASLARAERLERQVAEFAGKAAGSPEGRQMLSELLVIAADEITGQKREADEEIEQLLAGAREQAEQILADARAQADQTTASATQQAASLVSGARQDAKRTTDDATAHAAAVHEAAGARLARLVQIHEDTLARVQQMYEVTGNTLAAEQNRGSLGDEVSRALAPAGQSSARPY